MITAMQEMPKPMQIPLRNSGYALVDEIDYRAVSGYSWTLSSQGKGVVCQLKKQKILMHNLISPKPRVSFLDGDKRNCRRSNLISMHGNPRLRNSMLSLRRQRSPLGKYITDDFVGQRYSIHRNTRRGSEYYQWRTARSYSGRGHADALIQAREVALWLESMTPNEFIEFVKSRSGKRKTFDIIEDWSCYDGRSISDGELYQMGLFNTR